MPAPVRFTATFLRETLARHRSQLAALVLTALASTLLLPGPWDASGAQAAQQPLPARELVQLRSAKTKTVREPDGRLKTTLSEQSLHFFDKADKTWKEIDASFKTSTKVGKEWESGKNRFSVELEKTSKEGFLSVSTDQGALSLSLEGGAAVAGVKARENVITFKDSIKDVDLEYVLLPDGLKESIVLRKPGAPSEYRFRLTPAAGQSWRGENREDGVWLFREAAAEPAFILLPPVVGDSSDQATPQPPSANEAPPSWAAAHGKASLDVSQEADGSFLVTLSIDQDWLSSAERVYPVVLDPTLYVQPDTADGEYNTTAGGNPNVSATEIRTGRDGSGGQKYASVLSFDLAALPPGAKVLDARLNAYLNACFPTACGTGHTGDVELRRLNANGWSAATPWSSVSVNPTLEDKVSFTTTPTVNAWHLWSSATFTQSVQSMVNGTLANYGLILEKNAGNDTVGYKWRSARWSDPSFAPYLEVYWVADGVQLDPSERVHANGAELVWQHYAGGTSAYADAVLGNSPTAYWRLDEGAGSTTAWDWSGADNTAAYSGGYTLGVPGNLADLDTAVTLDGSSGKATGPAIPLANSSFSVETWARRSSIGTIDWIVGHGTAATNLGLHVGFRSTNEFTCSFFNNDLNTPQYTDTNWHHWVCTYDVATNARKIYRDGVEVATGTASADYQGSGALLIGNGPSAGAFAGTVDEVAIYPAVLTPTQVSAHFSAASTPLPGFQRFEIHRSATPSFTPSASTLIGTVADAAIQTFRDTTAKPSSTFYYEVVTVTAEGSFSSNELKADLPAQGLGKVTIQPGYLTGAAGMTHIAEATPDQTAGTSQGIVVGSAGTFETRALVAFDMHVVPTGATVSSAKLEMYALHTTPALNLHRVTSSWLEGGATWNARDNNTNPDTLWATPGGDFDPAVTGTSAGGSYQHWDSWELGPLLQQWINGTQAHNGVLLKYGSENGSQPTLIFAADGYSRSIALRPRLVITYEDGSQAVSPTVAVSQPAANELVKGTVTVKAGVLDDGSVSQVEFFLDGNALGGPDMTAPYEVSWNTTTASRGSHTLTAKATDEAGNQTTSAGVTVTVANSTSPTTSVTSAAPQGGGGSNYASTVQADSPNAYWRLGETSGTAFSSTVNTAALGNGTHFNQVAINQPGAITGDSNTAVSYDGINDYSTSPDHALLDHTSAVSLEAWVKRVGTGVSQAVIGKPLTGTTKNENYALDLTTTNALRAEWGNGTTSATLNSAGPIGTGWTHVVTTFNAGAIKIYVDGVLSNSGSAGFTSLAANADPLYIGKTSASSQFYSGLVDEVAVYPGELSATQVLAHYNASQPQGGSSPLWDVIASASDDIGVSKVEFLLDGDRIASDSSSPYAATLDTLAFPAYDGARSITTKAYDADGNVTTSASFPITVANTSGTKYKATISTSNVPLEQSYDPAAGTQDGAPLTVSLTNTSTLTWPTATTKLRYQWFSADATPAMIPSADVSIGADLGAGQQRNVNVTVDPPTLPAGVYRARYKLRIDLIDTAASAYFAAKGNAPYETWVTVTREVADELGLERYQHYDGDDLGGGFDHALNLANGNNVIQWVPFSQPGRGLNTVVTMTYNALEAGSVSPLGNNWSLSISSLTPFGLPLDVHPNAGDTAAGRTLKWVGFTDADGSYHVFTGNAAGTYYTAPPGVHLYLKSLGASGWELWKPDRTKFVFDSAGFPTSVQDANGNALTYTLVTPAAGEDAYGLAKRVTTVTDAGGRDFTLTYFTKAETPTPAMRGKLKKLTDHVGHALEFSYYEDGNLRSIKEKGGPGDDGMPTPDREVVFTYTTPDGTGPAIGTFSARQNPDPATVQSPKLFSLIDFRGAETQFAYSTAADPKKWRLTQRTNRVGNQTTFAYDTVARTTTGTMPLSRIWTYTFDTEGRVTQIDDPVNTAHTTIEWADATAPNEVANVVRKVTAPTGKFVEYAYNANGYKTDEWDENTPRAHTSFEYQNLPVDADDISANWEPGRSIPHFSQLSELVKPVGNATATPTTDYRWTFTYTTGNPVGMLASITDSLNNTTNNAWNTNGTLATQTLPANGDGITRTTTYNTYDANGLPTQVTDAAGGVAMAGYAANGNLLFEQDPNHGTYSGGTPSQYRSEYRYDAYGRVVSSSQPKSTALAPGLLVWVGTTYDANDNSVTGTSPHYGRGDGANGALTTMTYDAMDRATLVTGPRTTAQGGPVSTKTEYDAAGRVMKVTGPKGVNSVPSGSAWEKDYLTETTYDLLDREQMVTAYAVNETSGLVDNDRTRVANYCYDDAGDLRSVTQKGQNEQGQIDPPFPGCPNPEVEPYSYTGAPHTTKFEYDSAHRQVKVTDAATPVPHVTETTYDENGQVIEAKDEAQKVTQAIYDDRGLQSKTIGPFDTGRTVTTISEYDPLGNLKRLISPRAFDAAGGQAPYTDFVESFSYDANSRLVTTALPTAPNQYAGVVKGQNAYAYWRLGEASGTNMADSSGNGRNGTYVNNPTLGASGALAGDANTAMSVPASNYGASVSGIALANQSFSISLWMKRGNTGTADYAVSQGTTSSNNGLFIGFNAANAFTFGFYNNDLATSATYTDTNWHHWAVTYDVASNARKIYRDGVEVASGTASADYQGSGALVLGSVVWSAAGNSLSPGSLDEVGVWTRVLAPAEMQQQHGAGASGATPAAYRHQAYDPNSQTTWTSLPTTAATPGAVTQAEKTQLSYWDTGAIYSSQDPASSKTRFDYTAEGWQASRLAELTTQPGTLDLVHAMYWEYLPDGLVRAHVDQESQRALYSYDANGNRTQALEATGVVSPGQSVLQIDLTYNSLGELSKVRTPKPGASGTYLATLLDYDLHGNTAHLTDNREENGSGSQTAVGRVFTYTYNAIDQAIAQVDDFATTATTDDEQLTYSYTVRGELDTQTLLKRPSGSWDDEQSSARTYFDNSLLKTLTNKNGAGTMVSSHALSYLSGGAYLNGNRVSDVFQLKGPDPAAACYATTCTASWTYDARERVTQENPGAGSATNFTLDVQGNVIQEVTGTATTTRTFAGQQLQSEDFSSGQDKRYLYDSLGNTDCVVKLTYSGTSCPVAGAADLLEDNVYDYKSRLAGYRAYNGSGGVTKTIDYTNDPLDRPVKQVETISGATTTYDLTYVGATNMVTKEVLTGSGATTKKYAYDAFGRRATISEGANRYSYLYDPHGSVSLLIDQANVVKESYGYSAYGASNGALTKTAAGFNNKTNPYRYTGKRLDSGSGTYDMGARRYSASTGRFLQSDLFYGSLANLGLATGPLSMNRYALAGANPINFVELDGHRVCADSCDLPQPGPPGSVPPGGTSGGGGGGAGSSGPASTAGGAGIPLVDEIDKLREFLGSALFEYCRDQAIKAAAPYASPIFGAVWSLLTEYENRARQCITVGKAAFDADAEANARFSGENIHGDGRANAFRHAYWSALIVLRLGGDAKTARFFTDQINEVAVPSPGHATAAKAMDVHNNRLGRTVALLLMNLGVDGDLEDGAADLLEGAARGIAPAVRGQHLWRLDKPGGRCRVRITGRPKAVGCV